MKDTTQRIAEVKNIYRQFYDLGLSEDICQEFFSFKKIANDYVRDGYSRHGKINMESIDRILVYNLTESQNISSSVILQARSKS
jgi:endonuclease III-like uncharacterized protein